MSDKQRDTYLRRTYGITLEFYRELLAYQGGKCFICHRKPGRIPLAVDHNHMTGEVRGLVCVRSAKDPVSGRDFPACNRIIGMARDNPAFFRRGADYLENPPARRLKERQEAELISAQREIISSIEEADWNRPVEEWFDHD
jgi:hypothetical protein